MLRIRFKRTRESHNARMCLPSDLTRDGQHLGVVFAGCGQWDLVHKSSGRVLRGHSGASATGGGGFGRLPWTQCGADVAPLGSKTTLEHPFSALRIQSAENKSSVCGLGRTMHICRMRHLRLWLRSQTCGNTCWAARTTSAPFGLVRLRSILRLGKNGSQESRRSGPLSIPIRLGPTPCITFALWACTGMRRGVVAIAKFWS